MALMYERMWIIDVEGNGAHPPEIVELAMVEVFDLEFTGRTRNWRIKPEIPISKTATRIHGITNEDVAHAPTFDDIVDDILIWIEDFPIVGHNVRVELDALNRALPDWRPVGAVDTLKLARILRPNLASYSLVSLADIFDLADQAADITGLEPHSALYDATVTGLLLFGLLRALTNVKQLEALRDADITCPNQGSLL